MHEIDVANHVSDGMAVDLPDKREIGGTLIEFQVDEHVAPRLGTKGHLEVMMVHCDCDRINAFPIDDCGNPSLGP
jgi:hypothetical protein